MKRMHGGAGKRTFGLCILMATVLFGPAVAKADPVLDWNVIAVDTGVANGQNPFAPGAIGSNRTADLVGNREDGR
jgi:hypothetical protein